MQKLILLFCLLASSINVKASCCAFELAYTPEVLKIPEEGELLQCMKREHCDSLFLFTARMIRAYEQEQPSAVTANFRRALSIINTMDQRDTSNLKIVYLYATFMEREGESTISLAYYKFTSENSHEDSILKLLSEISIAGIRNNTAELEKIKSIIIDKIEKENFSSDETLSILIRFGNYLHEDQGYDFSQNQSIYKIHSSKNLNTELYYIYLGRYILHLIENKDQSFENYFLLSETIFQSLPKNKYLQSRLHLRSLYFTARHKYNKALEESTKLILHTLDEGETIESIKKNTFKHTSDTYNSIHSYATANLFQTRVRPGIEPVKKAFSLYELAYRRKLNNSLLSVNGLIADKLFFVPSYETNILIVGYYLYQKTNDLDYISRAVSIVDGHIGAGNYYWSSARAYARSNDVFWQDILAQRAATNSLADIDDQTSLTDIFSVQKDFTQRRAEIQANHSGFFEKLTDNSEIDLTEVSDWCARDSSGILAFYMLNGELYRLLVTPDTVSVTDMYKMRTRIVSAAEELASIANPKHGSETSAEAGRSLYTLLFDGIDSLLMPNLHIVATGELENVPFAALRRDAPGEPARYLGVEVAISRQMSINSMRLMQEQEMAPRFERPLGMAPAFANEALAISDLRQAGFVLPPLLYSTDEVKSLEERGPGSYFYGDDATLPNYLAHVTDYSIVHLATHAISSQTDGLRSRIYLTSENDATAELYASDIGDKTLNADLVVLSACETGSGGQHAAEGRISLTKAYLAAGARSVVSSNWAVDDFATATLMDFFYEHIQDGKPPHQALQLSRKAYVEKYPTAPPYKWAAFEAYGGMKAVRWDQSRSKWPLVGYGSVGLVALILGAAYFRRRRSAA